jgi:hypothetical protein
MHPIERFRAALAAIPDEDFPEGLTRIDRGELEDAAGGPVGVAAFPLSHGLYADPGWDHRDLPPFPPRGEGVLAVGNHPHSKAAALERLATSGSHGEPDGSVRPMNYWLELYLLLDTVGIERQLLFATNVHPAFHSAVTGRVSRRGNPRWFAHARALLREQVITMRPRLTLTFGADARTELASMAGTSLPLNEPVRVDVAGRETIVLHTRHPSAPGTTARHRSARVEAVAAAWELSSH